MCNQAPYQSLSSLYECTTTERIIDNVWIYSSSGSLIVTDPPHEVRFLLQTLYILNTLCYKFWNPLSVTRCKQSCCSTVSRHLQKRSSLARGVFLVLFKSDISGWLFAAKVGRNLFAGGDIIGDHVINNDFEVMLYQNIEEFSFLHRFFANKDLHKAATAPILVSRSELEPPASSANLNLQISCLIKLDG